jgi:hypothetical protein
VTFATYPVAVATLWPTPDPSDDEERRGPWAPSTRGSKHVDVESDVADGETIESIFVAEERLTTRIDDEEVMAPRVHEGFRDFPVEQSQGTQSWRRDDAVPRYTPEREENPFGLLPPPVTPVYRGPRKIPVDVYIALLFALLSPLLIPAPYGFARGMKVLAQIRRAPRRYGGKYLAACAVLFSIVFPLATLVAVGWWALTRQ